jgi:hypothetical protein
MPASLERRILIDAIHAICDAVNFRLYGYSEFHSGPEPDWSTHCQRAEEAVNEIQETIWGGAGKWIAQALGTPPGQWTTELLRTVSRVELLLDTYDSPYSDRENEEKELSLLGSFLRDCAGDLIDADAYGFDEPAPQSAAGAAPEPVLDETDVKILKALAEYKHAVQLFDLAMSAKCDRDECAKRITPLIEHGFATWKYPKIRKKRPPVAITQKGLDYLSRLKQN